MNRFALTVAVLIVAVSVGMALGTNTQHGDFAVFYWAGQAVLSGQNPYDIAAGQEASTHWEGYPDNRPLRYLYPPFAALVFWPYTLLPYPLAERLWLLTRVLVLSWGLWTALRELSLPDEQRLWLVAGLFSSAVWWWGYGWSQSSAVAAGFAFLSLSQRQRQPYLAGALWALVAALKPTAGMLAVVYWRKPRVLLGAGTTVLLGFALVRPDLFPTYIAAFGAGVGHTIGTIPWRVSLLGLINTFWPTQAGWLYPLLAGLGLLATVRAVLRLDDLHGAALALAAGLVFVPVTETHHLVLAVLPVAVLLTTRSRWLLWIIAPLLLLTPQLGFRLEPLPVATLALIALWAGLLLRPLPPASRPPQSLQARLPRRSASRTIARR